MKTRKLFPTHSSLAAPLAVLTALLALWAAPAAHTAALTWDTVSGNGATIDPGSGAWDLATANWNDGVGNVLWTQSPTTNSAIFAGTDGAVDSYVITLGTPMATSNLTFNSTGYQITGSTLAITNGAANGPITMAAGKTNTINSTLRYNHNTGATITANAGSALSLGGGTTASFNPQLALTGEGTINITAGTYQTTIGNRNAAIINHTGGTWTMSDQGTSLSSSIGNGAGRNVSYTVSGAGTLNVLANNTATTTYTLSLGRTMGDFRSTLTLQTGGTVNIGVTANRAGQLNLGSFDANGNSLLDVQGGTLTVGTGKPDNKLYFFAAGANAGKTATMTQSGGTVTANGIQFGANIGANAGGVIGANAYAADSSATLQLSGGSLYVGAAGIVRGSAAAALPVTIQLQSGTLGASADWSSSLAMKLGTTAGGVTVQAANSGGTARNITLSGILSDDGAVNGSLTKTGLGTLTLAGANLYTGATTVSEGELKHSTAGSATTAITVAASATGGVLVASADGQWVNTGSLTNDNFSSLHVDFGLVSPSTTVAPMKVASLVLGTDLTMRIDGLVSGFLPGLTFPLVTWTGSGPTDAAAFTTVVLPIGISGTLSVSDNTLSLTVTGNTSLLSWNTGDGAWDTVTTNWVDSSLAAAYYVDTLNAVMFDDAAGVTGNPTVTLNDTFSPLGVLMKSTNHDYIIGGAGTIAGSGGLILDLANTRTLTLTNANNTFTGKTTIGGGTLRLGGTSTLGGGSYAGAISIASGATFENAGLGVQTLSGPVTGGGTLKLSSGQFILTSSGNGYGALNIVGAGRVFINTSANALPTAATASITSSGLLVFGVGASYGNPITIGNHGGLCTRNSSGTTLSNVTLPGSGTVIFNNDDATTRALTITSGQTLTGNLTVQISGNRMTVSTAVLGGVTLAGALTGSGGLTLVSSGNPANTNGLNGSGVLTLTGTNTYTGNTTVSNGTLAIAVASIATNSTVTVAGGGAKLQLDFATTNRVGALVLNGVTQTSGVYNSTTGAPFITGLGSLEVVSTGPSGPATLTNSVSGGVLSLAWPAGQGWRLECQTNPLTVGLGTNWVEAAGSSVSNTNITIDATRPTVFYRLVYP